MDKATVLLIMKMIDEQIEGLEAYGYDGEAGIFALEYLQSNLQGYI